MIVGTVAILAILSSAGYVVRTSTNNTVGASHNTSNTSIIASKSEDDSEATNATTQTASSSSAGASSSTSNTSSGYKNGSYKATASYSVPRNYTNDITVDLVVKDGVISSLKVNDTYSDRESQMYIDSFESSIQSTVVGKPLDSAQSLSRVGGASLTTYGFDDAIQQIINNAKA